MTQSWRLMFLALALGALTLPRFVLATSLCVPTFKSVGEAPPLDLSSLLKQQEQSASEFAAFRDAAQLIHETYGPQLQAAEAEAWFAREIAKLAQRRQLTVVEKLERLWAFEAKELPEHLLRVERERATATAINFHAKSANAGRPAIEALEDFVGKSNTAKRDISELRPDQTYQITFRRGLRGEAQIQYVRFTKDVVAFIVEESKRGVHEDWIDHLKNGYAADLGQTGIKMLTAPIHGCAFEVKKGGHYPKRILVNRLPNGTWLLERTYHK